MKCISLSESNPILYTWGYSSFDQLSTETDWQQGISFPMPKDSHRKLALSRLLVRSAFGNQRCATYVFDDYVFGSPESEFLLQTVRKGFGEERPLDDSPVHITTGEKGDLELIALLAVVQFLILSSITVTEGGGATLCVSHDEYINLQISDESKASEVKAYINEFLSTGD